MEATCEFHCVARVAGEAARARSNAILSASFSSVRFQSPSLRRSICERSHVRERLRASRAAGASQAPR